MFPVVSPIFTEQMNISKTEENDPKIHYAMHDGKMIYALAQLSQYSRKHHPFLLCKCKHGEGVNNANNVCTLLTEEENLKYYDRSKKRFNSRKHLPKYYDGKHRDWCDENNFGITHCGILLTLLPRENIRFDTFHLRSAITKKLQMYLRVFIFKQSHAAIVGFTAILLKFWGIYHVSVWRLNEKISAFNWNEKKVYRQYTCSY